MEDEADFDLLEERLMNYPALAIAQCHRANERHVQKAPQECQQSHESSE